MIGFESFKGRQAHAGKLYDVYRNLNRRGAVWYSLRDLDTRQVVGHCRTVTLSNAAAFVNIPAQQRIADGGPRSVHAWVRGRLVDGDPGSFNPRPVIYWPHESPLFRFADQPNASWISGPWAVFTERGMFV